MKKLILIATIFTFLMVTPVFAVDFDATLETVTEIQGKVNDLYNLVGFAKQAKFVNKHLNDVPLTAAQVTILTTKYQTLKSELQTLFQQLP